MVKTDIEKKLVYSQDIIQEDSETDHSMLLGTIKKLEGENKILSNTLCRLEEEGTMLGKGNVKWCFDPPICAVNEWCDYMIRFDAEDGNAKLKLNLVGCRLTEGGYESIKNDLDGLGRGLRNALLE